MLKKEDLDSLDIICATRRSVSPARRSLGDVAIRFGWPSVRPLLSLVPTTTFHRSTLISLAHLWSSTECQLKSTNSIFNATQPRKADSGIIEPESNHHLGDTPCLSAAATPMAAHLSPPNLPISSLSMATSPSQSLSRLNPSESQSTQSLQNHRGSP